MEWLWYLIDQTVVSFYAMSDELLIALCFQDAQAFAGEAQKRVKSPNLLHQ